MFQDGIVDERESDAVPSGALGGEEGFENIAHHCRIDSLARVGEGNAQSFAPKAAPFMAI